MYGYRRINRTNGDGGRRCGCADVDLECIADECSIGRDISTDVEHDGCDELHGVWIVDGDEGDLGHPEHRGVDGGRKL